MKNLVEKSENSTTTKTLANYYRSKSLPEIIGASRKELSHSGFIASILNNSESHLLGDFAM